MTKERLKYLLERYLGDQATEEELQEYANWYDHAGSEGLTIQENEDGTAVKSFTKSLYNQIINDIDQHESRMNRTRRLTYLRWSAAAAVILIAGAFFLYQKQAAPAAAGLAERKAGQTDSLIAHKITVKNKENKIKKITLNDSSVIKLYPGAVLAYEFTKARRSLYLTGKGAFDVAKDARRPFTVYSRNIATTALGTSFTVKAYSNDNSIEVQLHTGKIVVKHSPQGNETKVEDKYLLPGQLLQYDLTTGLAKLQTIKTTAANIKAAKPSQGSKTGYEAVFDQVLLTEVLDSIQSGYVVPIHYNKKQLSDIYFSGNIRKTDSLAQVLKRIAMLHSLRINTTSKGYTIKKDQ